MTRPFIPNSSAWITDLEIEAVTSALREGRIGANEANVQGAKEMLKQFTAGHDALLTTSCTAAMELALNCFDLQPQDEVIVPSFTFVSTANAVLEAGAKPVFIDIEESTLNLDLQQLENVRSERTKGIMPVHYGGISCDMDALLSTAKQSGMFVIEDAAHAVGASYKGRPLGTLGDFGCFSFHDTKNYVSGEGGALIINNLSLKERSEWIHEKGTNRSQFLRGEIDKYTWVSRGSSYIMSAILAELLRAQLQRFEEIRWARQAIDERYRQGFQPLVEEGFLRFTDVPAYATPNHHLAFFLVNDVSLRDPLLRFMKERGVGALFHYLPLHLSPYAIAHLGTKPGQCPVTEKAAASLVRLPLFPHLKHDDCDYVIEQVHAFFKPGSKPVMPPSLGTSRAKDDGKTLDFSLIVPCYNEAPHLQQSLDQLVATLDRMDIEYELILMDDCSRDETVDRIKEYMALHPRHRVRAIFHQKNAGRGGTVTEGIRMARGRFCGFMDIDLEIAARYLPSALLPLLRGEADMVLADRYYKFQFSALQRYLMSKVFRFLVRNVLRTPPLDTEAGFKFFRRDAILPVLEKVADTHWFWDTEVTVRAHDAGLRIRNEQVLFDRKQNKISTVKAFSDSWKSLKALLRLKRNRLERS